MENEQEKIDQEEIETYYPSRKLTVAMNVDNFKQSAEGAKVLSNFINVLEEKIGFLDLDLSVSINPFLDKKEEGRIGYSSTCVFGESVEVENEFDYDDEDFPEDRKLIK